MIVVQAGLAMLLVAAVATGARGFGRVLVAGRGAGLHAATAAALEAAVGLIVLSTVTFATLFLGGVSAAHAWALVAAYTLFGIVDTVRTVRDGWRPVLSRDPYLRAAMVAVLLWMAVVALAATLPPSGIDELIYHLDVPRRLLESGGFPRFTDNVYAYFPQGGDMLVLLGLATLGEVAAKLFHALAGVLTALAVYGVARSGGSARSAALAALAWLTVPTVLVTASWAYVDLHFALYAFLALVCAVRLTTATARVDASRWAVLAGLMAGGAWTAKYTGLQLTLLLMLLVLAEHLRQRRGGVPWAAATLPVVAGLIAAPYLVRNLVYTGWPLFPFALGPLPMSPGLNWSAERSELYLTWLSMFGGGVDRTIVEKLLSPLTVFLTARFDDLAAFDGMAGPVFLLAPLALLFRRDRETRLLASFAGAFLLYWAFTTTQVRFLLPVLPAAAVLVGRVAMARRPLALVVAALVALNAGLGVRQVLRAEPLGYWADRETREQYLTRRVAGYPLYAEANRVLEADDRLYLLNMRTFGYLLHLRPSRDPAAPGTPFPAGWRGDYIFQQYSLGQVLERARGTAEVAAFFADLGITHLMIDERLTLTPEALEERQRGLLVEFIRERAVLLARNPVDPGQSLWGLGRVGPGGDGVQP